MIVPYRPDIISKEYAAELVRNHILCYQGRVVDQLMLDSVFINIDSVNLKYQVSCGIRIDSILNGELE